MTDYLATGAALLARLISDGLAMRSFTAFAVVWGSVITAAVSLRRLEHQAHRRRVRLADRRWALQPLDVTARRVTRGRIAGTGSNDRKRERVMPYPEVEFRYDNQGDPMIVWVIDGQVRQSIPIDDGDARQLVTDLTAHIESVSPDTLHHPGCDDEQCPLCGGQSISCTCDHEDCPSCGYPTAPGEPCEWCGHTADETGGNF